MYVSLNALRRRSEFRTLSYAEIPGEGWGKDVGLLTTPFPFTLPCAPSCAPIGITTLEGVSGVKVKFIDCPFKGPRPSTQGKINGF
mmetsp:Transcript_5612/g.13710  ORF Transcript_5612/g.13710 Transcript_5612/m.13710 type:complete len:86 (+) Transcript_5612:4215-4472(+)